MGILRVVEWRSRRPVDQTDALLRSAIASASIRPAGRVATIVATSKRSLRKNRAATVVRAEIAPRPGGGSSRSQIDTPGSNHGDLPGEIADHLPDGVLDDRGITTALARAGLLRLRGRSAFRHLHRVLGPDESVIRLGLGHYRRRHGILVLTTDRVLFIDKNLPTTEPIDEFPLASVASISIRKSRRAETLVIHTAARRGEISHMAHGQAGGIAAALRNLTNNYDPQQAWNLP